MGTIVAGGIVVVALAVLLVLKKRKRGPKKEKLAAVAISDPAEIKALKKNFTAVSKAKLTNSQLMQLAQEEAGVKSAPVAARPSLPVNDVESDNDQGPLPLLRDPLKTEPAAQTVLPAAEKKPEPLSQDTIAENLKSVKWQKAQETIEYLEKENKRLKGALEQGVVSKAAPEPGSELESIKNENVELKRKAEEERARFDELDKKFSLFKNEFDHMKSLEWAKEEAMQHQILKLKEENEGLTKTKEAMERRKNELESLQDLSRKQESDLQKLHDELNEVKTKNVALAAQLSESLQKASQLKQEMEVAKLTLEQKLSDATDRLISLQQARENAKERELNEQEKGVLEQLRVENEKLLKAKELAVVESSKLKEMNEQLREREKVLQYELTKSRAQSIGLEKICEDFKEQIEIMSKAANES